MSVAFHHQTAPCPLCGSSETSRSRLIKGFILADCAVWGLRYVPDRVPEDEIMEYYRYEYFHSSGDPTNGYADYFQIRKERERTFARHLKIILKSLLARASGRRSVSYKLPEHVSYFDTTAIGRMLAEAGLRFRGWRPCGQFATIDFVAKRLSSLFFGRRDALPVPPFLEGRMVYVNTGSMLAMAGHGVC